MKNQLRMLVWSAAALLLIASPLAAKQPPDEKAKDGETVQTPFGPAKKRTAEPPSKRSKGPSMVDVKIEGDQATFSRKTPFGVQRWTRKVSELSSAEKALVEEAREAAKPDSPAKKDEAPAPKN